MYLYFTRCIEKYTGKIIHLIISILICSSFCVLNFMFHADQILPNLQVQLERLSGIYIDKVKIIAVRNTRYKL